MISQLELQKRFEALVRDDRALEAFLRSPQNAMEELQSWGLKTGLEGAESCVIGLGEFQSLLRWLQHEFAVQIVFAYIYAGSGSVQPRPGGPHLERFEPSFNVSAHMTALGLSREQ